MNRRLLVLALLFAVTGCVAPARSSRVVAEVAAPAHPPLRATVAVGTVTTPELKPPVHSAVDSGELRQAVELSLQRSGYLRANPDAATMLLAVAPISLENADIGITVTSRIRYTATSRASGAPLFNEVVVVECSRYAFSAGERLQHSTECSVRKNIETQKALLLQVTE